MSLKQTHLLAMLLVRHTNHKLNYDDNCLIYLLSCKCCGKQYVWEPTDNFKYRWNNFKDLMIESILVRRTLCKNIYLKILTAWNTTVSLKNLHYNLHKTLTVKADDKNPKKREDYWRRTFKAYPPFELNVEDSV